MFIYIYINKRDDPAYDYWITVENLFTIKKIIITIMTIKIEKKLYIVERGSSVSEAKSVR